VIDGSLSATLLAYGPLGVFCILLLTGWIVPKSFVSKMEEENDKLRASREAERQRADAAVLAATTATQVIASLREVIEGMREVREQRHHAGELP
jgi:hypothetical protein